MKRGICWVVMVSLFAWFFVLPVRADEPQRSSSTGAQIDERVKWDPPGELILADVLILRPLGIAALGIGLAGSLVTMPFAATSNSGDRVGKELIQKPFEYTFTRPVGDVVY
ncbi:MAG TPA: hypothetical protein PLM79_08890 [Syntrophobacteraceae bacterium]|nr:hypothetical protein [Syntrophobacteraceae bacterium]